jgi:hypothetical protein
MKKHLFFYSSYDDTGEGGFTEDQIDSLWDQGVDMDDWDCAIITDPDVLEEEEYEEEESKWEWFSSIPDGERVWPKEQLSETSWRILGPPWDKGDYKTYIVKKKRWNCKHYELDRILTGCCSNKWYLIEWEGQPRAIGVAYHA